MEISDILGASVKQPYQRKSAFSSIDYRDITSKGWESSRRTNPLCPKYKVRDTILEGDQMKMISTGLNIQYGKIEGNECQALPPAVSGVRNLETLDIKGA